ncbi:MAG: phosphatidylglycerol lysyltransferase domain-containing protein, partial [Candidatus Thermoplasmatota archaeon]
FISLYPIYASNSYYLDLTRRSIDSPRSTIDYLIVETLKKLKEEGADKIYIGFSPLSFIGSDDTINPKLIRESLVLFKPIFKFFYPAKSEFFFKDKFATDWEPNYICYYPRMSLRLLLSLIYTIYPGGIGGLILNKIKYSLRSLPSAEKNNI